MDDCYMVLIGEDLGEYVRLFLRTLISGVFDNTDIKFNLCTVSSDYSRWKVSDAHNNYRAWCDALNEKSRCDIIETENIKVGVLKDFFDSYDHAFNEKARKAALAFYSSAQLETEKVGQSLSTLDLFSKKSEKLFKSGGRVWVFAPEVGGLNLEDIHSQFTKRYSRSELAKFSFYTSSALHTRDSCAHILHREYSSALTDDYEKECALADSAMKLFFEGLRYYRRCFEEERWRDMLPAYVDFIVPGEKGDTDKQEWQECFDVLQSCEGKFFDGTYPSAIDVKGIIKKMAGVKPSNKDSQYKEFARILRQTALRLQKDKKRRMRVD